MQPYYEHAGITIHHGFVVNCDVWMPTKEHADTGRASAVKTFPKLSLDQSLDSSNLLSMSPSVHSGGQNITRGWAKTSQRRAAGAAHSVDIATSARAGTAERKRPNAIISTATRQTMTFPTSPSFVGAATCKGMAA